MMAFILTVEGEEIELEPKAHTKRFRTRELEEIVGRELNFIDLDEDEVMVTSHSAEDDGENYNSAATEILQNRLGNNSTVVGIAIVSNRKLLNIKQ